MAEFRKALALAKLGIRARIVTGLAVIAPLALTAWVIHFLFTNIDGLLQPYLIDVIGRRIPGAGLLATLLVLYFVGLIVQNLGGRTLLYYAETVLLKLPFLKDIYSSSKTVMDTFTHPEGKGFKRVVAFEYPRQGTRAFGFVTNEVTLADGTREVAIFLPTTPNPTSGYLIFVPEENVEETTLAVEEAIKMIVSGGVVVPRPFAELLPDSHNLNAGPITQSPEAQSKIDVN